MEKITNHPNTLLSRFFLTRLFSIGYSYDVFGVEELIVNAKYLWTFDDANDIKDHRGRTWAQKSSSFQSVAGVRGRAMKTAGGPGPIRLAYDTKYYLSRPATWSAVTVSLWLLYQSTGPGVAQTFLAAGDQENGDRGVHLYQEDGSREELTFSVKVDVRKCTVKFGVPQRVWTNLIFTWSRTDNYVLNPITAYRDGKIVSDSLINGCNNGGFADLANDAIALGSSTLPTASIDDVMVLEETLSQSQVEKLFRYYKGKRGLICVFCTKGIKGHQCKKTNFKCKCKRKVILTLSYSCAKNRVNGSSKLARQGRIHSPFLFFDFNFVSIKHIISINKTISSRRRKQVSPLAHQFKQLGKEV